MPENDYVIRVLTSLDEVDADAWNTLLAAQAGGGLNPFMRYEYLAAMQASDSAVPETGWTASFITLWQGKGKNKALAGACALYVKTHSYGEYVFDWAWANAYQQHGLGYYPKAIVAAPFTPVPGPRLLARDATERALLAQALIAWCTQEKLSSLHVLFADDRDVAACEAAGLMLRHTVQFHWTNTAAPSLAAPPDEAAFAPRRFADFDAFLMSMNQEKRKKIRQERRKVSDAGIRFRWSLGRDISDADWVFFYRCYERTYYEHGNAPYLTRDFFQRMQNDMPDNWLMFIAEHSADGVTQAVATSLVAVTADSADPSAEKVAYGRYWGALARVDSLHFEACYYQPLQWCIDHGFHRFEGGAQGEHKMARALLPVRTTSAHWLAHPSFADAVERFLEREGEGIDGYMASLEQRNPFKQSGTSAAS